MNTVSPRVQEFFTQYAHGRSVSDIGTITAQYGESFMFAGPTGGRVIQKTGVVAAFPKGREWLQSLGHVSTGVQSLDESSADEHYTLVRAAFVWRFHEDFQHLLRASGVLPPLQ